MDARYQVIAMSTTAEHAHLKTPPRKMLPVRTCMWCRRVDYHAGARSGAPDDVIDNRQPAWRPPTGRCVSTGEADSQHLQ